MTRSTRLHRYQKLKVCLTCIELFGSGIYGGFGRATRMLGRELVKRGVNVTVVTPRRAASTPSRAEVDGVTIREFNALSPRAAIAIYRECDADIYHSQDPWLGSWLAMRAMPQRQHIITFRDPRDSRDWSVETAYSGQSRPNFLMYRLSTDNPLVKRAVRRADVLRVAAAFLGAKVKDKYSLREAPPFLATPVDVPNSISKAEKPTVCFVGRFDPRKRPELFFDLARQFPEVDFIAVGESSDAARNAMLAESAGRIANLTLTGAIDQFGDSGVSDVMSKSWIIVNTSAREGLPTTFVEAAAHRCAILSLSDPDAFASRFGYCAQEGDLARRLEWLLDNNRWKELGERGYACVAPTFAIEPSLDAHLALYESSCKRRRTNV